jgi:hypothetical protein
MQANDYRPLRAALKARFEANMDRHPRTSWEQVEARLASHPAALRSLAAMEASGGEPDVIGNLGEDGRITFCDCSP